MATKVITDIRSKLACGAATPREIDHIVNLVEEYGDALLRIAGGGSEMFRRNGSEVDPKACVDKIQDRFDTLQRIILKLGRKE